MYGVVPGSCCPPYSPVPVDDDDETRVPGVVAVTVVITILVAVFVVLSSRG